MPPTPILHSRPSPWQLPMLGALFFFSGACALVYQVMWLRLLSLVFGVTVYAASTVLAAFMAGLALGSFAAGRLAGRFTRPLLAFGVVEIGVGLSALGSTVLLDGARGVWLALQPQLPESMVVVTAVRLVCAFVVLLVPTSFMGATLPLIVEAALRQAPSVGARIGLLYALNTGGAIAGALVAGFYLISEVGVRGSFALAATINMAIGLLAVVLATRGSRPAEARREPDHAGTAADREPPIAALGAEERRAILGTFFLSGFLSLALEIVWFRMLVVYLRPTAYAFTMMLAVVLGGLSLGSGIATLLLRRRRVWVPILAVVQLAIGVSAVLSFNALARSHEVLARLAGSGSLLEQIGLGSFLAPIVVSSMLAILPTAVLLGGAFPIGLSLWVADGAPARPGHRLATFLSVNLVGAILGSLVGGFVLLPLAGSQRSLVVVAGLAVVSSVWLAWTDRRWRPNFAGFVAFVGPVVFLMCALNTVDPFDVALARFHRGERLIWRQEGVQTTVAVHERPGEGRPMRVMYLDGMHQANDSNRTAFVHQRLGALPVMLHPNPKTALVVGLGGGATPGAVSRFGVDVDVVELSDAVVAGSRYFASINFDLLTRPNVRLRVDDGRNFLMLTAKKYEVITADIILPRHAGAGALYSREYFQLVRRALAPGGLVMQWNGAETETEYKLLLRTFLSVFPDTTLWGDGTLMLGSLEPFTLSQSAYEVRRETPGFTDLYDWNIATMRRLYVAGPAALAAYAGPGPLLTDDKPVIEYFLSLPEGEGPADLSGLVGRFEDVLRP